MGECKNSQYRNRKTLPALGELKRSPARDRKTWGNLKILRPGTGRLFQHGGKEKVSLPGPEDFSDMGEGKTGNSKDIMLQHHDARSQGTVDI